MSNFFEQELRKLFGNGEIIHDPKFVGRACLGTLCGDLRVRAEFITMGVADQYEGLRLTVLNHTDGEVDKIVLRFGDVFKSKVSPAQFSKFPYMWTYRGVSEWYNFQPASAEYQALRRAAGDYLDVFRDRQQERPRNGPKLVYICAPLQSDMAKNVEFAQQKAKEVFQNGSIPLCPQLMFAAPKDPVKDQTVQEMGLRLIESCNEVHVYGSEWTEGMWVEIRHAMELGIEIKTGQKTIGRSQPHRQTARKGKGER